MSGSRNHLRSYVVALLAWALAAVLALKFGSTDSADLDIILQLRLPRVVLASAVGISLAVAGAALQALFANPLCEPYTLGISSGSALGAVLGASLGLHWMYSGLAGTAFLGALAFTAILYGFSLRPGTGNLTLLLAGVMLSFLGSSFVALWIALSDAAGIQGAMVWLFGDLSRARLSGAVVALGGAVALSMMIWTRSSDLDAMLMGEEGALALGVPVVAARRRLIVLSSLLIGLSVSGAGMIGFIGLVVPHFARRMVGSLHARLIPLGAIWGACALTATDLLARAIARPYELPVGVVTAFIGAPLFLWVILQRPERR